MRCSLTPSGFPSREEILQVVEEACRHLGLAERLDRLDLVLDATEFEGAGYWSVDRGERGVEAALYGSPRDLLGPPRRGEDRQMGLDEERLAEVPGDRVDLLRVDRWMHRNLLQLEDILDGRIRPSQLPAGRAGAFQACWDVWTDGRLKQRALPGVSLAERRRAFFRSFAAGGLLLPRHWDVFHRLWEDRIQDQGDLLEAVRALPPSNG